MRKRRGWLGWAVGAGLVVGLAAIMAWSHGRRVDRRFDALIAEAAQRHAVDPALVKAVIKQESRFDPDVRGKAGEIGLMQVGALAVKDWEVAHGRSVGRLANLFDPRLNIEVGTWYLSRALQQWAHREEQDVVALVQYNAGRQWALKVAGEREIIVLQDVPIASTRQYISNVRKYRTQYAQP